ncbi:hypothetical protein TIFTF001_032068 [Ficus carica]|uniref:Uncharacterized protein n=1 Tax=Ficus carica TaxID=3494 RepID=A0AA88J611_FICCA|nr:hypothetical protein TIFTF001_032068 [Ficus carica]
MGVWGASRTYGASGARLGRQTPVCGARRPPSGAPGALLGRHGRLGSQAPVWGARRTSGAPGAPMARI